MGFIENWLNSAKTPERAMSDFERMSEEEIEAHLAKFRYGTFELTDAIRPGPGRIPEEGYRHETYKEKGEDEDGEPYEAHIPVIITAASREKLFDLFMDLVAELGDEVDIVLETSHKAGQPGHRTHHDIYGESYDNAVLRSGLYDYEHVLLNDGCTGIAVMNPETPQEVQFDEHKLLIVYGQPLEPFEDILQRYGVRNKPSMKFVSDGDHVHTSDNELYELFCEMREKLSAGGFGLDERND